MKTSMLLSAESTPTSFLSVKGLSSPFLDEPASSLTVSSHVIDISPSPPPPASILGTIVGRFQDPFSPDDKAPTQSPSQSSLGSDEITILEPVTLNSSYQPIGLGLGIETGESTFVPNLLPEAGELSWGLEQSSSLSTPQPVTLSTRRVQLSPWPAAAFENITPEQSEDSFGTGDLDQPSLKTLLEETVSVVSVESFSSPSTRSFTPVSPSLETVDVPSISQRLTRRLLSFSPKLPVGNVVVSEKEFLEAQTTPIQIISPQIDPTDSPMPLSMKFSPRGRLLSTLRHRMTRRGIVHPEVVQFSPVLTSRSDTFTAVSPDTASPLEVPSSPAFPSQSPNLRETPGSFSPLMYDSMPLSPALANAPLAHALPGHAGASTLVLSIVAVSLGFVGICLVLAVLAWKKNGGFPGLSSWKRKHRGTAYDEFMEEKSCWVADKELGIHCENKPNPERTVIAISQKPVNQFSAREDGVSAQPVSRSPSQAPSIPPLAYLVNGKLSIDSIRLEFPAPVLSPTVSSLYSGLSSNYEDDAKHNDYRVISTLKNRALPQNDQSPQPIDFSDDKNFSSRPRSNSKSSTTSKASLKSISSIASFLLGIAKLDSLSAGNKKAKPEMGISSENYKNVRDSLNSVNDPFSRYSPKHIRRPNILDFNQSIKRVESAEGLVRAASAQLGRLNHSLSSHDTPKRPNTISFVPPAILITDHPSELIPPSPPHSSTYEARPESIGTFLARYSNFNPSPEHDFHAKESGRSSSQQADSAVLMSNERLPSTRQRTLTSGQDWRVRDPRITSISSLISHRDRTSEIFTQLPLQDFDRSNAKYDFAPKRTSLNTLNSSQTIRELAAVTEDLRALIDSEMDPDSSWDFPSQFHQTVPDWVDMPPSSMPLPPTRPPKSASRYSSMKSSTIEYESTSTPCSPHDPNPLSHHEHFSSTQLSWVSPASHYPDAHFERSSSSKGKRVSTGARVRKSDSVSTIETLISAESNASILEIASLHTAQTQSVRGVSAEFVIRQSMAQIQALEAQNRLRMKGSHFHA
ncbi:uncharacterized protein VP01_794g3 [Puccinia sorghi]|uniref:Uncharacterized protein n=1 Tax=Puccinia sorghi TaxID=27349 RepID=A0A0L6UAR4_9BASI|nr:uncharacterized protein VP01_794g3 [Puccinia sorghi]